MAWYRRSKLGLDMFRNFTLGCGKVLTSSVGVVGLKKNSNRLVNYYVVAVGVATGAAYLSNRETIPYSKRTRVMLVPRELEKAISNMLLQRFKKEHEGKLLPDTHPMSVRVGLIAKNVIDALQRDLIRQGHNKYLEHVNWEVFVVDDPDIITAGSYGAGNIFLYTGLIMRMISDHEIATVIGHEVAHILARHGSEALSKCTRVFVLEILFNVFFGKSAMRDKISALFVYTPLNRKLELEADYIGLLLMASAGYDPRIGVKLMEKWAKYLTYDYSYCASFFKNHPPLKKRLQIVSKAQDEAMNLYMKRNLKI